MKRILFICIGLTGLIAVILVRLYSDSVISFVGEVTDTKDTVTTKLPQESVKQASMNIDDYEEEDIVKEYHEYEDEYLDTIVNGMDTTIVKINPTYVDAIVDGNQRIKANIPVKFKVIENIEVKDKFIPANTVFYAMPEIKNEDVNLSVNTFQTKKGVIILSLHSLKEDLMDVLSSNEALGEKMLNSGDTVLFDY